MLLGIALTLNFGLVSATDSSNNTTQNLQTTQTSSVANLATTSTNKVATTTKLATTSTTSKTTKYAAGSPVSTTSAKTIRVLVYNGNGAITSCVNGVVNALKSANSNNLVPGYYFTYGKSTSITSSILANYDLLVMPGGTSGYTYINSNSISSSAIKNFISSGHGFLGICAGAYAGSKYVGGSGVSYNGWGVAPHVSSKVYNHEGSLKVLLTSSATQLLGSSGTLTLAHYNGPALYGTSYTTFASYSGGAYNSYAAIVGDTYGNGRTVLSGPHPELSPTNYTLLDQLIVWAANVSTPSTTSVTISQINKAAKDVKAYVENNHKLPVYITVGSTLFTRGQFLYFLTTSLQRVNSGSTSAVTIKTVVSPGTATDTVKTGTIQKSEFLSIASRITSFIGTNGRAPAFVSSKLGNIRFENLIYMYSKIMAFYYNNGRLPTYVSMTKWTYGS
ncbi:pseudomurein-binding repeat-containing protein [Methanobacterium sp. SMA-27]|uniref:pseudomurein-binding repeat-containing protein n=1 Tax=Methanobacterium sp. SMA-27 TaxID=1495336 RepID=UPI000693AFF6|nr:pseudomurein-binding repeat-containing protein [Methanobacterium sp. SMA-27]